MTELTLVVLAARHVRIFGGRDRRRKVDKTDQGVEPCRDRNEG